MAQAKLVDSLYSADKDVVNQSTTERNKAISSLFESVLVKISGRSDVLNEPLVMEQRKHAMSYITTFNYQKLSGQTRLVAAFNESSIDNLLKQAGVSIWGSQRPTAMIWLAYRDENNVRHVVSDDGNDDYASTLKGAAKARGMPMLLPLWDLEDQFSVSAAEVWGMFPDSIGQANVRYATDFMVLSKITHVGLTVQLNWAIYKGNSADYNDIVASGLDELSSYDLALAALVDQTSDFFARQYSVDTSAHSGEQMFVVTNIDSIAKYAETLAYLNGLKGLETVYLKHNKHHVFTFAATVLGNPQSLIEVLKLEQRLIETFDDERGESVYLWQGAN